MSELNFSDDIILVTHDGKFHAGDVFSTALLCLIKANADSIADGRTPHDGYMRKEDYYKIEQYVRKWIPVFYSLSGVVKSIDNQELAIRILRTKVAVPDINRLPNHIMYDIGFGEFDRHKAVNKEVRENGIPYGVFGLIYRKYGRLIFKNNDEYEKFEKLAVQPIDDGDATGALNILTSYISTFMPLWNEPNGISNICDNFKDAVLFAMKYIDNYARKAYAISTANIECESGDLFDIDIGKVIVLDKYVPFNSWAQLNGVRAAIYPSTRGDGYLCAVVNDSINRPTCLFPEDWWGTSANDLMNISGIETLRFCHRNGFIIATDNVADALRAASFLENISYV